LKLINENIHTVLLEGSRATPNIKVDEWSYDIVFVTRSNEPYLDKEWFNNFAGKFGKIAILQTPDDSELLDNIKQGENFEKLYFK
jgi:hypothetical protein